MLRTTNWVVIMLLLPVWVLGQTKPEATVEKTTYVYKGDTVKARLLTVSSTVPMPIEAAWSNVQTPELLQFVAKGMIRFRSTDGNFPKRWEQGKTYGVKMRVFGFVPFGGTHHLFIKTIDPQGHIIATEERDRRAKVWNHTVTMTAIDDRSIVYEDKILIYGGKMTGMITAFAKRFYKHRQKRWQKVAKRQLKFYE